MNAIELKKLLSDKDEYNVDSYINYCQKLIDDKKTKWWIEKKSDKQLADLFNTVSRDGLVLDGDNITLQSTGVSYNYVAYRNKMFLAYPESIIDIQLVYQDDTFRFRKESGKVIYEHEIANPFDDKKEDKLIGGYFVVKNKRGEFLTTLSTSEIEKHRKVAKTQAIWDAWFTEMCLKTIIKKGCKQHFKDIFQNIETLDNENYDLGQSIGISVETKQDIDKIDTVDGLTVYYKANNGKNAGVKEDFVKALADRKEQLLKEAENENPS